MEKLEPVVKTLSGSLRGRQLKTEEGFEYFSYQGIRYAKAPIGELRFKAPQPLEPWSGIKDASTEGGECSQINMILGSYSGSEDCLFLNVYTPKILAAGGKDIPVMVFIHGGGFVMGSGATQLYGPDYLIEENVIIVTINYRIGPLGFLSLENENLPGNAGLKDQVAALRWVRDNITFFGGNPNNVTIFGESAGGASVNLLLLSDSTKGLFHRAISESGCATNPWVLQRNPRANALRLCKILGHPTEDVDDAFKFLQAAASEDLVAGHQKFEKGLTGGSAMVFVPIIEHTYPGQEPFITECASHRLSQGKFHQVPYMTGYNSEEGLLFVRNTDKIKFKHLNKRDLLVPADIPRNKKELAFNKIKEYYFANQSISNDNIMQYAHLKGDTEFFYGIINTAKYHSKISKSPVYLYKFSFEEFGLYKMMLNINLPGVCHADELGFLFKINMFDMPIEKGSKAHITRRRMVKLWTNFAKYGNPTPASDTLIPVLWQPVTTNKVEYLDINEDLKMAANDNAERYNFVDELYRSNNLQSSL